MPAARNAVPLRHRLGHIVSARRRPEHTQLRPPEPVVDRHTRAGRKVRIASQPHRLLAADERCRRLHRNVVLRIELGRPGLAPERGQPALARPLILTAARVATDLVAEVLARVAQTEDLTAGRHIVEHALLQDVGGQRQVAAHRVRIARAAEAFVRTAAADARPAHALRQAVGVEPVAIGRQLLVGAIAGGETRLDRRCGRLPVRAGGIGDRRRRRWPMASARARIIVATVVGGVRLQLAAAGAAVVGGIEEFRVDEDGQFVFARSERLGDDGAEELGHCGERWWRRCWNL